MMIIRFVLVFCMAVTTVTLGLADKPGSKSSDSTADSKSAKQDALNWIDGFRKEQVLFHREDINRVRGEIADGTEEEAQSWWKRTADVREALDSDEWKDTRNWLTQFLEVQAIYSDEEIDDLRKRAEQDVNKDSPDDFMKLLTNVEKYRRKLAAGSANANALREQQLKVVAAFHDDEAAQREATLRQSVKNGPKAPIKPPVRSRPPRHPTGHLIDSLDVARWSVFRSLWGRF